MAVRVLIADSDEFTATTYADCLRQRGAIVTTASTGLECLARLHDFAPDVLVLEPELLWGGGDGVLAVIHEQPELRPTYVVLVSYARDRSLLHRVSRFKADDYQVKPLSAARLANRLSRLLGSQPSPATRETATVRRHTLVPHAVDSPAGRRLATDARTTSRFSADFECLVPAEVV